MIPFDTLHAENHEIAELAKVLSVLIQDREICDTRITCELFERYAEKVTNHMEHEQKTLYSPLLAHHDRKVNATAQRFLEGAKEIKKIFERYKEKWCARGLQIYNHDQFLAETDEMFSLIRKRIQAETEELYPMARSVEAEKLAVAG